MPYKVQVQELKAVTMLATRSLIPVGAGSHLVKLINLTYSKEHYLPPCRDTAPPAPVRVHAGPAAPNAEFVGFTIIHSLGGDPRKGQIGRCLFSAIHAVLYYISRLCLFAYKGTQTLLSWKSY